MRKEPIGFHLHDPVFHSEHPDHAKSVAKVAEHSTRESAHEKGVHKYGDVKMAEPEQGKFPIDTPAHIRAARGYERYATPEGKKKIDAAAKSAGIGQ